MEWNPGSQNINLYRDVRLAMSFREVDCGGMLGAFSYAWALAKGSGKAVRGSKEVEKRDTGYRLVIGSDRSMMLLSGA